MIGWPRSTRLKRREERDLDGLDEVIVRVTTWVALVFSVLAGGSGLISGDQTMRLQAITPGVIGIVGGWMLLIGSPRVIVQLAASGLAIAITTGVFEIGSRSGALYGLLSMGIVGALVLRREVLAYIVSAAFALFAIAFWWNVGGWASRERIAESMVPAFAFVFAAGLVVWLKRELLVEGSRRRKAATALATSEEQFRTAFEMSAAGMVLMGVDDGRFLEANRASCEMLGYDEGDLLAMTIIDVMHPEDREQGAAHLAGIAAGELEHSQATLRYLRRDGSVAYALVSAALVRDVAGRPLHIVGQAVDTSDQHAAEQRLIDLLSSRDELIASVSHELRTPLTAVLGYAGLLLEAAPGEPPDDYATMLSEIVDQGSDLVAIIEDLLVFAQSDAQSLTVTPSRVNMKKQLGLVLGSLQNLIGVDDIKVSGPEVTALADPIRVRQVLRNLLSNAGRYGGNAVVLTLEQDDSLVLVSVSDNGSGVLPQDRERIFEPYQRSRPEDGLTAAIGVGLTVARRLARLMDGELTYDYSDGWSRFVLSLPAAVERRAMSAGVQPANPRPVDLSL